MSSHFENFNFKESQGQIVQNLTQIDSIATQENITPENIKELHRIYTDTILWIDSNFANLETDIIYQLLEFLSHYYEVY